MTWQKKQVDGSTENFNFKAPSFAPSEDVLFPVGKVLRPTSADELTVHINQMATFLQPSRLEQDMTVNLAVNPQLTKGAMLMVKLYADENEEGRTVSWGTGFDVGAGGVLIPDSGVVFMSFSFDGTVFVPMSSNVDGLEGLAPAMQEAYGILSSVQSAVEILMGAEVLQPPYSAVLNVAITKMTTFLQLEELTDTMEINLSIAPDLLVGAKLYIALSTSSNFIAGRTCKLRDGFLYQSVGLYASMLIRLCYVFDGTEFIPCTTGWLEGPQ